MELKKKTKCVRLQCMHMYMCDISVVKFTLNLYRTICKYTKSSNNYYRARLHTCWQQLLMLVKKKQQHNVHNRHLFYIAFPTNKSYISPEHDDNGYIFSKNVFLFVFFFCAKTNKITSKNVYCVMHNKLNLKQTFRWHDPLELRHIIAISISFNVWQSGKKQ